jgi:prevent-host-death family protein
MYSVSCGQFTKPSESTKGGSMGISETERKPAEVERVPATEVRDRIAELMNRAGFGGERFIITRNGEPTVAIVGLDDLKRLEGAAA